MGKQDRNEEEDSFTLDGLSPGILQGVLPYHAYQMHKALSRYADVDLSEVALERSAFRPLLLIYANPGVVQGRLARALDLERSSIVPAITKLEREGLVERRPHPEDKRSKCLYLTPEGLKLAARIEALLQEREKRIFVGFSARERSTLLKLMQRATRNIWLLDQER